MDKLDQAVARIELAISNQNTKLEAALGTQARSYIAWVALIVGIAVSVIKFF